MSSKLKLTGAGGGNTIIQGNDSITTDQTFTLPDNGGEIITTAGAPGGGSVVGHQQGTWTCVLSGSASGTTTITSGQYIWARVGNQVFIDFNISGGNKTTSGDITLEGLPYAASSVCNQYTGFIGDRQGINYGTGYDDIYVRINGGAGNTSEIQVMQKGANQHGQMNNGGGSLSSTFVVRGHISYRTSDTTWTPINGATVS